jgi:hypothetical protein
MMEWWDRFEHWLDHTTPGKWVGSALGCALVVAAIIMVVVLLAVGFDTKPR